MPAVYGLLLEVTEKRAISQVALDGAQEMDTEQADDND